MTKQDLQKELKEKVKEGVKPSHLKKLKRSKSADDIPTAPASVPLRKSQSQLEAPLIQPNPNEQITQLKEQVKFHAETATNYLKSLQISQAKVSELEEKLKEKGTHNDALLVQLAEVYEELNKVKEPTNLTELDQSLTARHQNLKDWFSQYQKTKKLDKELAENVEEASNELISQDNLIGKLRGQVSKLKNEKESLQKDLKLASRLAESRKVPYHSPESNWDYLKYALYSLGAVLFTLWLTNNLKSQEN